MNIERFKRAIGVLKKVPQHNFDMNVWGQIHCWEQKGNVVSLLPVCGTAGCAIGWIASDPWMQKQGLRLFASHKARNRPSLDDKDNFVIICRPGFGKYSGFTAAETFFEITPEETEYVFAPESYNPRAEILGEGRFFSDPIKVSEVLEHMEHILARYA